MIVDWSPAELARYSRQMVLPQVGAAGQQRLRQARVLVIGAGGLGVPAALYLAAAGVGHLALVDDDKIELSNLQRQVIFTTADVGQDKVTVVARHLRALNPGCQVTTSTTRLAVDNVAAQIAAADLVLDCTDNFSSRYLINDFCRYLGQPWLFAAIHQFRGQLALFTADTACFRCLYPRTPVSAGNCNAAGVLGTVPGLMALWQTTEAIKHLLAMADSRPGQLWACDTLSPQLTTIALHPDPHCWCATQPLDPWALHSPAAGLTDSDAAEDLEDIELDWAAWRALADAGEAVLLIDLRGEAEHQLGNVGGLTMPDHLLADHLRSRSDSPTVGLYCQRGQRSLAQARQLRADGIRHVFSLKGGIEGWH